MYLKFSPINENPNRKNLIHILLQINHSLDKLLSLDKIKVWKLAVINCIVYPAFCLFCSTHLIWDHCLPRIGQDFHRCPSLWVGPNFLDYTMDLGNYGISLLSWFCANDISQSRLSFSIYFLLQAFHHNNNFGSSW